MIQSSVKNCLSTDETLIAKCEYLEGQNTALQNEVVHMERRLENIEQQMMKDNVIIYNVEQEAIDEDTKEIATKFLYEKMKITNDEMKNIEINDAY